MKMPMICIAMLAALGMPATADTQYDRKLEKAVMGIIAGKMGGLRGGFAYDVKPAFVMVPEPVAPDPVVTGSIVMHNPTTVGRGWQDGLALAVERKVSRFIAF